MSLTRASPRTKTTTLLSSAKTSARSFRSGMMKSTSSPTRSGRCWCTTSSTASSTRRRTIRWASAVSSTTARSPTATRCMMGSMSPSLEMVSGVCVCVCVCVLCVNTSSSSFSSFSSLFFFPFLLLPFFFSLIRPSCYFSFPPSFTHSLFLSLLPCTRAIRAQDTCSALREVGALPCVLQDAAARPHPCLLWRESR